MSSSNKLEDDWSRIGAWVDPSLISSALFAAELDAFMEKRMQNPIVGDKAAKVKGVQKHLRDTKADALWGQSNAAVVTARWQQVHTVKRSKTQPLSSLVTLTSGGGGGAGSSTSAPSGSVASTTASVASPAGDMFEQMRDYTTTSEEYLAAAGSLALHLDLSDEASNSPNDAYFRQSIAIVDCTRLVEGDVVLVPVDIYLKPTTCAVVYSRSLLFYRVTLMNGAQFQIDFLRFVNSSKRPSGYDPQQELSGTVPLQIVILKEGNVKKSLDKDYPFTPAPRPIRADSASRGVICPITGKNLTFVDRGKLEERMKRSLLVRRLTEEQIRKIVMDNDVDFDADAAWITLTDRGRQWLSDRDHTLATKRWQSIANRHCTADASVYRALTGEGWRRSPSNPMGPTNLCLSVFGHHDLRMATSESHLKVMLCDCLLGLDCFLSFCFGTSYANTTWDIRQALETGGYSGDEWPALYLKWEIEGALVRVWECLRTSSDADYERLHPGTDIAYPTSIKDAIVRELATINATTQKFMRWAAQMGAWGKTGVPKHVSAAPAPSPFPVPAPAAAPSSAPSPAPAPAPAPKQGAKSKNCCLAQLLNTLAITDPTTKQPHAACGFGASCRFFHLVKGVHTKQDFEAGVQTISTGKKPVLSGAILKKVNAAVAKL